MMKQLFCASCCSLLLSACNPPESATTTPPHVETKDQNIKPALKNDAEPLPAGAKIFKVIENNPDNYGEESYQIKTTDGQLSIYTLNMSKQNAEALSAVQKGECLMLKTHSGDMQAEDGYISIQDLQQATLSPCR